ncbi:hypothetical protein KsCSTR_20390 [Candidatus Kuenenia stuttgartiensis]|uniref:Uncharacterized protein n=1 Tax=Kuenenia stuttgartiensis TaxID=174633 RepID=Q1Q2T4_KUEST|nr:hypothetical protein KsCSTR_20390 [Candidatus Kuenenia stuttgartiensis]TVM01991.1 MAG: hypothetical protein CV080_02525 [Candidatus Kuenenia stuttgartiensis]GJQ49221.1 MAG: hypothetical protein HKUEN01_16070 [Candidatus Kuenenia stuttgartiensis]CAJ74316.1 unknown protein [Candidatus Kuenenia stuttgartiensis]
MRQNILCCSLFLKIFLKALFFLDKKDFEYNIYSLAVSYLNTYSSQNFYFYENPGTYSFLRMFL